jgi:hypothetical protein
MSEREVTIRTAVVTYFPMFIAVLSLVTTVTSTGNSSISSSATSAVPNTCALARRLSTLIFRLSFGPAS